MSKNILLINSSGRLNGSVTRQLSGLVVDELRSRQPELTTVLRELSSGLPFVDESCINLSNDDNQESAERQIAKLVG